MKNNKQNFLDKFSQYCNDKLVYNSTLTAIRNNTQDVVYRVVATKDIEPGEEITSENVERVQIQNVTKSKSSNRGADCSS